MATYCVHSFFTGCVSEKGITQWSKIFVKVTSQQASHSEPKSSEIYYIIFIKFFTFIRKIIKVARKYFQSTVQFFSFIRMKYIILENILWKICILNLIESGHCVHTAVLPDVDWLDLMTSRNIDQWEKIIKFDQIETCLFIFRKLVGVLLQKGFRVNVLVSLFKLRTGKIFSKK